MKLLDYILGKEELMSKPLMPNLDMFKKSRQQSVVVQPMPITSSDTQSTVQAEDGESSLGVVHYSSLTEQAQRAYHFAYNMCQDQRKIYDQEQDMILKLSDRIRITVIKDYFRTYCNPIDNLQTWYENLKRSAGLDKSQARELVKKKSTKWQLNPRRNNQKTWIHG